MYCIRDKKARQSFPGMFAPNRAVAIRDFMDQVNDPSKPMFHHPDDYALKYCGTFDNETDTFECLKESEHVMEAADVKKPVNQVDVSQVVDLVETRLQQRSRNQ